MGRFYEEISGEPTTLLIAFDVFIMGLGLLCWRRRERKRERHAFNEF